MAQDPYKYFRIEARELFDQLGRGVLDLEKGGADAAHVAQLLRLAHTLKGAARVVKQRQIADSAHAIEDVLDPYRAGDAELPQERIDAVLRHVDTIGIAVAAITDPAASTESKGNNAPADALLRTMRADVEDMDALFEGIVEAHSQLAVLRRGTAAIGPIGQLVGRLASQRGAAGHPSGALNGGGVPWFSTVEDLDRLVGDLQRTLETGLEQVDRELRQVRQAADRLRLLPARLMFTPLERAARDAAQSLGRRISFESRGGDVRLDAHVLNVVQSALVQIVRNAVAHGIEPEADRLGAGKPPEGKVVLEVAGRGNRVSFACRDDGRGVDLEAVRRVARDRGIQSADIQSLGPEDLFGLLLKGGISTSGTVTEISGRGIGLDVVREAASRLGGHVVVRTEAGVGTSIEISAPVSLASLPALVVEADSRRAAIPMSAVHRTLQLSADQVTYNAEGAGIIFEDKMIPLACLTQVLRMRAAANAASKAGPAIVVQGGGRLAVVAVDRLIGMETLVLRPLSEMAPSDPILAGISLDAKGDPQIVLDPDVLVAEVCCSEARSLVVPSPRSPILVIDDSLTTRMLEQSILESAGYEVDLATSAEEGLEKARRQRYALFLVDVEMPGMDGFTFVERTRADASLRHVPAILVTSRAAPEDRQRGEEAGACAYIVKSEFDQAMLLGRLRDLVG